MRVSFLVAATFVTIAGALAGCDSCSKTETTTTAPSASALASAAPSTSVTAAPSASDVAPSGKMAHCPNAVDGAATTITDVEGAVSLAIVGATPAAIAQIKARSQALLDASKNQDGGVHHNGTGEGGGQFGRCPVVMRNTTLAVTDTPSGATIVVKPETAKELDWLRRETRERYADLAAPNSAGAGGGKMSHCPSAADGAITKVADAPSGVTLTITGNPDAVTTDIRARVKHLLDAAKDPAPTGTHDGSGNGGGGLGRCPIVLTDTKVAAKDVAGGSQVTVTATKPNGVDGLRRETRDRIASFAPPAAGSAAPSASTKP
ncbi:MAG: hypothetical protein ACRELY_13015 [Polyangiaceae bacterium]